MPHEHKKNGKPHPEEKGEEFEIPFADTLLRTLSVTDAAADATLLVLTTAALLPAIQVMMASAKNAGDVAARSIANMSNSETTAMATLSRSVNEILGPPACKGKDAKPDKLGGAPSAPKSGDQIVINESIYPEAFYGRPVVT